MAPVEDKPEEELSNEVDISNYKPSADRGLLFFGVFLDMIFVCEADLYVVRPSVR